MDVPPVELELVDPLEFVMVTGDDVAAAADEFCAARAATLLSRACSAEVDDGEVELVVVPVDGVVEAVEFVAVPELVVEAGAVVDGVEVAAGAVVAGVVVAVVVVAGVLVGIMVPAVVVEAVDEVPVVLVEGTADR